jgi:serine/threonine-protein kinase
MAIGLGSRVGPYEVTAVIGEGGMGKVWRAHHTALKRDDALKVLPDAFASDTDRLARFRREAQVLASLNHPNIAHVYGLEQADSVQALVMELVEGPTLADRIAEGPIGIDDALAIARQIAEALEAAHEQGIVHRDLKPANIKLRPDGVVKLLDFGLAKALDGSPAAANASLSPTITSPAMMTGVGVLLGTAAYMSPEQARGKPVDKRADIWAFGCVLYEMLTGKRAFGGDDVTDTLAAVVRGEPQWEALPSAMPPTLRLFLRRCLHKDVRQRVGDIRDMRLALEGAFDTAAVGQPAVEMRSWRRAVPVLAAVAAASVVTAIVIRSFATTPEPGPITRFALQTSRSLPAGNGGVLAVSPNGRTIAYKAAGGGIRLRELATLEEREVPGTGGANTPDFARPVFSPDGRSLAYVSQDDEIVRVDIDGGSRAVLTRTDADSLYWDMDGTLLLSTGDAIMRVAATGGTPQEVLKAEPGETLYGPQLLPDGDGIVFTAVRGANSQVHVVSLSTRARQVVLENGGEARFVPTGHLVYASVDRLMAIAFDPKTHRTSGEPAEMLQGVRPVGVFPNFILGLNFEVSLDGSLTYVPRLTAGRRLVWVDRQGKEEAIPAPDRLYTYVQVSPDGSRLALDIRDGENDIWIWDLSRQILQRLTFDKGLNRGVVWSPDGRRVAFSRSQDDGTEEVYWQPADGSGRPEPLTKDSGRPVQPSAFSPDGKTLLYEPGAAPRGVFQVSVGPGAAKGEALISGPTGEFAADISPDGRWVAYHSAISGRPEVYVRPFPAIDSGRWQVSTGGGTRPRWSRDGRELFYFTPENGELGIAVGCADYAGSTVCRRTAVQAVRG